MTPTQTLFLRSVALRSPYAFGETGDVTTVPEAPPAYPAPPSFRVNDLLPALRSERAKVGWLGFGAGIALATGGYALYQNTRRRSSRK